MVLAKTKCFLTLTRLKCHRRPWYIYYSNKNKNSKAYTFRGSEIIARKLIHLVEKHGRLLLAKELIHTNTWI